MSNQLQEYAKAHIGALVKVKLDLVPWVGYDPIKYPDDSTARIIGYTTDMDRHIIVEFRNKDYNNASWKISVAFRGNNSVILAAPLTGRVWGVPIDGFELIRPEKPITLYPSKCPKCYSSARKCGSEIMCSNNKCSTRSALKKYLGIKYIKADKNNFVCPKCGENIKSTSLMMKYKICINEHQTYYALSQIEIGSKKYRGGHISMWNGEMWEQA
jgi:hypothetical protein